MYYFTSLWLTKVTDDKAQLSTCGNDFTVRPWLDNIFKLYIRRFVSVYKHQILFYYYILKLKKKIAKFTFHLHQL